MVETGSKPMAGRGPTPYVTLGKLFAFVAAASLIAASCVNAGADPDQLAADQLSADQLSAEQADVASPAGAQPENQPPGTTSEADQLEIDPALVADIEQQVDEFLAQPSSAGGARLVESMGRSGDQRFGAWILDLYRLGRSTRIDWAATEAFARLSGIDEVGIRTDDYRNYGNWVYDIGVDPGPGYRRWKLEIYHSIDPEFSTLLAQTSDDVLLSQIQWGGVGRGGIPELNQPERLPAGAADWMIDEELVLGVVIDGQAVAYPVRILGHHELANDEIAGVPVSMVYCTLCRSGLLFDRRVDGQVLDFQTSGLLIESNKIMVDNQTDTLWRHLSGVGLAGALEGVELEQFPVLTTSWGEWIAEYPNSEVLAIPAPIFPDPLVTPDRPAIVYDYDPGGAYQFYYDDPDVWFPIFDTPPVFDLKETVFGISDGVEALAVGLSDLVAAGPQVFEVGDSKLAMVPTSSGALVYDVAGSDLDAGPLAAQANGFVRADSESLELTDGTVWNRTAVAQLFWFAWFGQHPDTDWWPR